MRFQGGLDFCRASPPHRESYGQARGPKVMRLSQVPRIHESGPHHHSEQDTHRGRTSHQGGGWVSLQRRWSTAVRFPRRDRRALRETMSNTMSATRNGGNSTVPSSYAELPTHPPARARTLSRLRVIIPVPTVPPRTVRRGRRAQSGRRGTIANDLGQDLAAIWSASGIRPFRALSALSIRPFRSGDSARFPHARDLIPSAMSCAAFLRRFNWS